MFADLQQKKQCHSIGHWERKRLRHLSAHGLNTRKYETPWQVGHNYVRKYGTGILAQWMTCLPGKHRDLSLDPSTHINDFRVLM